MNISTPDLCDAHSDKVQVVTGLHWHSYGGVHAFAGPMETVKCFEDNSRVKEILAQPSRGKVLVVDGGGSLRHALIGDQIAANATENGWVGIVIHGACRDVDVLIDINFGVMALGSVPIKSVRRGEGQTGVPLAFGQIEFRPGEWLYADANGIITASEPLT